MSIPMGTDMPTHGPKVCECCRRAETLRAALEQIANIDALAALLQPKPVLNRDTLQRIFVRSAAQHERMDLLEAAVWEWSQGSEPKWCDHWTWNAATDRYEHHATASVSEYALPEWTSCPYCAAPRPAGR